MFKRILILVCLLLPLLAACGSKEEKRDDFYKQAVEDYEAGRYTEAQLNVRNALKIDRKFAPARSLMGDLLIQQKEWRKAYLAYTSAVEEDPTLVGAHLGLAKLHLLSRNLDDAEESLGKALQYDPQNPDARVLKATILARRGNTEDASKLLDDLLASNPAFTEAYLLKSDLVAKDEGVEGAYAILAEGAKKAERKAPLLLKAGLIAFSQKDFDKAAEAYKQLGQESPDNPSYKLLLVNALHQGGKTDQAAALLKQLIEKSPENQEYRASLARLYMAQKDEQTAINVLEDAIKSIPDSYKSVGELVKIHLAAGRRDKALELLHEHLKEDKNHADRTVLQRLLVQLLASQGKYDEAKQEVEKLLARNPKDVDGLMMRGRLLLREGENLKAIGDFRQVLGEQPDMNDARVLLAQAHFLNKEPFTAVEELEKILAATPDYQPARELLMRHYMAEGKHDKLRNQLKIVAERNPQSPLQPMLIGDTYAQEQKWDKALETYKNVLERFPAQPGIRTKIATLQLSRTDGDKDKQMKEARQWLQEELTVQEDFLPAIQTLVRIDMAQGKRKEALDFVRDIYKDHQDNIGLLALKGTLESRNENYKTARQDFSRVIEERPEQAGQAYLELARTYTQAGELDQGIQRFEKAVADNPEDIRAYFLLGIMQEQSSNYAAAANSYRKALEVNPDFLPVANNLAYMLSQHATGPADLEEALVLAERAAKGGSPDALDTLGTVQLSLGRVEQALSSFMQAYEKAPENPSLLFHLARTHAMRGEPQKALEYLDKALAIPGAFPERELAKELKATLSK